MTTNNKRLISKLFVVAIIYLCTSVTLRFDIVDLTYLLFIVGCFINFLKINQKTKEE